MLKINLQVGESLKIGDIAIVTLEHKAGKGARLSIEADRAIPISRVQESSVAKLAALGGITGKP